MTPLHLIWLASVGGALLFFAAGAATVMLRRPRGVPDADAANRDRVELFREEIVRLRHELAATEATLAEERRTPDVDDTPTRPDELPTRPDDRRLRAATARAAAAAEIATLQRREQTLRGELDRARETAASAARELAHLREELARVRDVPPVEAAATAATARELDRARARIGELEREREGGVAAVRELEGARARIDELERELAARIDSVRDLATENEHLRGRLRDADAMRADYVRLRTAVADAEYLRGEIARLERELAVVRTDALRAPRPPSVPRQRTARGSERPQTVPSGTIGESLAGVLDRFADAGTRSIAIGDPQGFVLASSGDDGLALAAHAAQLVETATRATHVLPLGVPAAIEVVDDHGARVSVWTFTSDGERLLLASLGVSAPAGPRVETALAELARVLAPTPLATGGRP